PNSRCRVPASKQLSAPDEAAGPGVFLMALLCASGNRRRLPNVALAFALAAEQSWNGNGCGQSRDVQLAKRAVECRTGLPDVDAAALRKTYFSQAELKKSESH